MSMQTFVNLPVKDLARTTEFFAALGFAFDQQFTDENATRMIISDDTSVMLAVEPFFAGFIAPQDIADRALAAGAQALGEPDDQGFMYMRGFRDLDGHQWSFIHMEMSAIG
jgi:predicted lactoylglutathione lyase